MLQIFKDAKTIGREEGKREVAVDMLKEGMTIEQVMKITKMAKEEIEMLKSELELKLTAKQAPQAKSSASEQRKAVAW